MQTQKFQNKYITGESQTIYFHAESIVRLCRQTELVWGERDEKEIHRQSEGKKTVQQQKTTKVK